MKLAISEYKTAILARENTTASKIKATGLQWQNQ